MKARVSALASNELLDAAVRCKRYPQLSIITPEVFDIIPQNSYSLMTTILSCFLRRKFYVKLRTPRSDFIQLRVSDCKSAEIAPIISTTRSVKKRLKFIGDIFLRKIKRLTREQSHEKRKRNHAQYYNNNGAQ